MERRTPRKKIIEDKIEYGNFHKNERLQMREQDYIKIYDAIQKRIGEKGLRKHFSVSLMDAYQPPFSTLGMAPVEWYVPEESNSYYTIDVIKTWPKDGDEDRSITSEWGEPILCETKSNKNMFYIKTPMDRFSFQTDFPYDVNDQETIDKIINDASDFFIEKENELIGKVLKEIEWGFRDADFPITYKLGAMEIRGLMNRFGEEENKLYFIEYLSFYIDREIYLENYEIHKNYLQKEYEDINNHFLECHKTNLFDLPQKLRWNTISQYRGLSENFMRTFKDKLNWRWIAYYQTLSETFIKELQDKFENPTDWRYISERQKLSESFIKELEYKVCWSAISQYQILSESFIKSFQSKICWETISEYQVLSENFIKEFQHLVHWKSISQYQKLSKDFIEKFHDKVDWEMILIYQDLNSDDFEKFSGAYFHLKDFKTHRLEKIFLKYQRNHRR